MTHKFKFGDRVIDKTMGFGECVVVTSFGNAVYVINEQGDYNDSALPAESLELIQHPDTVRLAYIAKETDSTLEELRDVIDERITTKENQLIK